MSGPQYIVLPIQGQNGQLLPSSSVVNVSGNDQLQEQMAQSQVSKKVFIGRPLLMSKCSPTLLKSQSYPTNELVSQTIRRNNEATRQEEEQEIISSWSVRVNIYLTNEKEQAAREQQAAEHPSLIQQVTSDPSILYSLINWENPARTLTSFVTVMFLIISTHYLSPIQWILKILCTFLGATSLLEMVGRVATKDGIIARVQPQPYYRPSEYTYSRLFSELREAIDMALVKFQKLIFVEDLRVTAIAFALSFIAYWVNEAISPFWLIIITTMFIYTLGPILTRQVLDPNAPSMRPVIDQKTQGLKDCAVDTASSVTNQAANTVQDLGSQAIDTASSATNQAANTVQDLSSKAINTASSATNQAVNTMQESSSQAMDATSSATNQASNTVQHLSSQVIDTASSATDRVVGTAQDLGNHTTDAVSSTTDHITAPAQELRNRTMGTLANATAHGAGMGQELKNSTTDTAYSATDRMRAIDQEAGANSPGEHTTAVPHDPGVSQNLSAPLGA